MLGEMRAKPAVREQAEGFAMKTKVVAALALLATICCWGTLQPASATTLYLNDVRFAGGGTATGSFIYDFNVFPTGINITTSPSGPFGANYTSSNLSFGMEGSAFVSGYQFTIGIDLGGGYTEVLSLKVYQNFSLTAQNPLLTSPVPGSTDVSYEDIAGPCATCNDLRYIVSGWIGPVPFAPAPLPSALPLFATGLGALGLLGWRRKRKAAALAA
jgi:hypothetical protein